jgi:hypothetical protein
MKESATNVTPVKPTPITNGTVSLQLTPSPPPLPSSSSAVVSKSSARSDAVEQRQPQQEVSWSSDSINDQQWYMVSSSRNLRRAATTTANRRDTTDESQITAKTSRTTSNNAGKHLFQTSSRSISMCMRMFLVLSFFFVFLLFDVVLFRIDSFVEHPLVPSMSSSRTHTSVANQSTQARRRRGRRPACPPSPPCVPFLTKRTSLQSSTPLPIHNRELAFRQLTEQLWAAGLPSATTACAMSVRSRCSSAPASERGGADEEMLKIEWNNSYDDEVENIIDWDEPDKPDEGNGSRTKKTYI